VDETLRAARSSPTSIAIVYWYLCLTNVIVFKEEFRYFPSVILPEKTS